MGATLEYTPRLVRWSLAGRPTTRRAKKNDGRAYWHYKSVLSLLDEEPAEGTAYKLMRRAAEYDDETGRSGKNGFEYTDHHGQRALRANWDEISDPAVIHAVRRDQER